MPVMVLVETSDNNRGRFFSESHADAIEVLRRFYPVGASVAQKLTRGEKVGTDSYSIRICRLETAPPKRQQALF